MDPLQINITGSVYLKINRLKRYKDANKLVPILVIFRMEVDTDLSDF